MEEEEEEVKEKANNVEGQPSFIIFQKNRFYQDNSLLSSKRNVFRRKGKEYFVFYAV